jgi:hypothetical protein
VRRVVGQINLLLAKQHRPQRSKQAISPARKNSFHEPFQTRAKTTTTVPKFSSFVFPKFMSYYAHPASPRGTLRAFRHDT